MITGERIIPTTSKAISVAKYFLICLGRIKNIGETKNINGLTFAVGKVFVKFQSCGPFFIYAIKTTKK